MTLLNLIKNTILFSLQMGYLGQPATGYSCLPITNLPFIISKSGSYCVTANLYNASPQHAITIMASGVNLDLQNHKIQSQINKSDNSTYGIYSLDRRDITIKNGRIRGFMYGIYLADSKNSSSGPDSLSGGYKIKHIILENNTFRGIRVEGVNSEIVNNVISSTGGTKIYKDAFAMGIEVVGPGAMIANNIVYDTHAEGKGESVGISFSNNNSGAQASFNKIINARRSATNDLFRSIGIWVGGNTTYPSNVYLKNNTIINMDYGLVYSSVTTGWYGNNQITGSTCPVVAGNESISTMDTASKSTCIMNQALLELLNNGAKNFT